MSSLDEPVFGQHYTWWGGVAVFCNNNNSLHTRRNLTRGGDNISRNYGANPTERRGRGRDQETLEIAF
jgi:hypothetical protein